MRHHGWIVAAPIAALLFAACGTQEAPTSASPSDSPAATPAADPDQPYTGIFTVLESPEHGPQLCAVVGLSHPPACSGPDISGWNWDEAADAQTVNGVTWGFYSVTGSWDGGTLTLTEPPLAGAATSPMVPDGALPDFTSPCEPPVGGWAVLDAATATQDSMNAVMQHAAGLPDFAGAWIDPSQDPTGGADPTKVVVNIRFTGDLEQHEAELRTIWGGPLCVSEAERTDTELRAIQEELVESIPFHTSVGVDPTAGVVELHVFVDDGLQEQMDEQYGAGVVRVSAALRPVQ
jgi:hypothetical protein